MEIAKSAQIDNGVTIRSYVRIDEDVILHTGCIIGSGAHLSRVEVGVNSHIESGVIVTGHGSGRIRIGHDCYVGINNVLDWSENLTIGNYVHIAGPSTGLWTHSSVHQALAGDALDKKDKRETKPIRIEDCVYIGGNCTIYPGVTIGHHSIVAPNSAVTENIAPHTMVGGVPAKVLKTVSP